MGTFDVTLGINYRIVELPVNMSKMGNAKILQKVRFSLNVSKLE